MAKKKLTEERKKNLRIVYQKTQDSAEHHNNLMWNLIYIGLGLSLFIFYQVRPNSDVSLEFKLLMLLFGVFTLVYFSIIIESSHKIKNTKYEICKKIESILYFDKKQHTTISKDFRGIFYFRILKIFLFIMYLSFIILISLSSGDKFLITGISASLIAIIGIIFEISHWRK